MKTILCAILIGMVSTSCSNLTEPKQSIQIAFMADVHLHDVYAKFDNTDYQGILNPKNNQHATIRTMASQLHSTRIFNENYFAFVAALDDVVGRGIKYVVMPGDFSDDGQPMNILALQSILQQYSSEHGITFLLATGNHDPVRPFDMPAGKTDFLGIGGREQVIMSQTGLYEARSVEELPTVITPSVQKSGYESIIHSLSDFGFYPKKQDLYWSTPFASYDYDDYDFDLAQEEAQLSRRTFQIGEKGFVVPDVSYVTEPIKGVWFLSIDGNVYIPKESAHDNYLDPNNYGDASIGYNEVLTHKQHLIEWVKKVSDEAKKHNKVLIPFSHFPMIDFNDDATADIRNLFGADKMQLHRVPQEDVAMIFADAGLKVHFGGHMHINDTGKRKTSQGNSLINVQVPSLAAYIPAYKIATIQEDALEIETVPLHDVPRYNELFELYRMEHDYLTSQNDPNIWNKEILKAKNYHDYTQWHLKELIRFRFLEDWPVQLKQQLLALRGSDLLFASQQGDPREFSQTLVSKNYSDESIELSIQVAAGIGMTIQDFEAWTGYDLILDFYRLHSADELGFADIGAKRLKQYEFLLSVMPTDATDPLQRQIYQTFHIIDLFAHGAPADHFMIDMKDGNVTRITE
ncbi:metallophosphoesterase [Reichenbachiella agarivorans]|uniref:Metallophosphoesterase n=1 Tax=Reichenbachiella agarivorans TaxID=2979464 RepID=A0ABY6CX66_9BACT|nr:metallophosphoesterase [Reichenbachiella agarivorans]UXP32835.1 metallophosphoesterase [Reichenbachiella agarivorans]